MKILILFLAMLILHLLTPFWWWVFVLPLAYGFLAAKKGWRAFAAGMCSAGLLWFAMSVISLLTRSETILAKVNVMVKLPGESYLIILAATIIAMLCGGFAALTGFLLRAATRSVERRA